MRIVGVVLDTIFNKFIQIEYMKETTMLSRKSTKNTILI